MVIDALNIGSLGRWYCVGRPGTCYALLPEPVDADACLAEAGFSEFADTDDDWDAQLDALIRGMVEQFQARLGGAVLVAPEPPETRSFWSRLRAFGGRDEGSSLNPLGLDPAAALSLAARNDSALAFARLEFSDAGTSPVEALLFTSDGHSIVWAWLGEGVEGAWPELVELVACGYPTRELAIDWGALMPASLRLARELPRVGLHRGERATWTDGERRLSFHAGLGVTPPEVYLPSTAAWAESAPAWAAARAPEIVADFQRAGVRVVYVADGWVGSE
jgi:hypothetical protein